MALTIGPAAGSTVDGSTFTTPNLWIGGCAGPIQTEIPGLVCDYTVTAAGTWLPNPGVAAGRQFVIYGQSSNTSAGSIANQETGTFAIPAGTANGALLPVPNTLIGATSMVFCQLTDDDSGNITKVTVKPSNYTAGTSFKLKVVCGSATVAATDVWYRVVN